MRYKEKEARSQHRECGGGRLGQENKRETGEEAGVVERGEENKGR